VNLRSSRDSWISRVHEVFEERLWRELWVLAITAVQWLTTARVADQPGLLASPSLPATPVAVGTHDVPRDAATCVRRDLPAGLGLFPLAVDEDSINRTASCFGWEQSWN
jgi:hypothetical protein